MAPRRNLVRTTKCRSRTPHEPKYHIVPTLFFNTDDWEWRRSRKLPTDENQKKKNTAYHNQTKESHLFSLAGDGCGDLQCTGVNLFNASLSPGRKSIVMACSWSLVGSLYQSGNSVDYLSATVMDIPYTFR